MLSFLLKTSVRKWLVGLVVSTVASALGFVAWNAYKDGLRDEGRVEAVVQCNEAIYKANAAALEGQLEAERRRAATLSLRIEELRAENEAAINRRAEAESRVAQLLRDRKQQASTDETYRTWSAAPVPDGVVDRLRQLQEGGAAGENSN